MRRFCPAGGHPWRAVSPEPRSRAQTKAARAGPAGTALGKGSASPFIREETGLKRVQDLPQTTSKGAGIQIQIVFDSKSQTVYTYWCLKQRIGLSPSIYASLTPAPCFEPCVLCINCSV